MSDNLNDEIKRLFGNDEDQVPPTPDDEMFELLEQEYEASKQIELEKEIPPKKPGKPKPAKKEKTLEERINSSSAVIKQDIIDIGIQTARKHGVKIIDVNVDGWEIEKYMQNPRSLAYEYINPKVLKEKIEEYLFRDGFHLKETNVKDITRVIYNQESEEFDFDKIKNNILVNNALISFKDGKPSVIHQTEQQLPGRVAFRRVRINYREDLVGQPNELVEKFLSDIMCGEADMIEFLMNALATMFLHSSKYETAFFFYGPKGANGKSTLQKMIKAMIGKNNMSETEFAEMSKGRGFEIMDGKLVNWVPDMEKYSKDQWTILKKATSGETVMLDKKFIDPVEREVTAQLFVNTNILPKFGSERDGGKDRRVTIIPFMAEFTGENRDTTLTYELQKQENLEWLFAQLIQRASILAEDEKGTWFLDNTPELVKKAKEDQIVNDSTAVQFMMEVLTAVSHKFNHQTIEYFNDYNEYDHTNKMIGRTEENAIILSRAEVYRIYKDWCSFAGYKHLNLSTFKDHIKELGFKNDDASRVKIAGIAKQGTLKISKEKAIKLVGVQDEERTTN